MSFVEKMKPFRIPPYLKVPEVRIRDISDTALDERLTKLENLLGGGSLENVDISVETLARIASLESQVSQLKSHVQSLEAEVSHQAETDIRHDAHIEDAERTAEDINQLLDKING